LTVTCALTGVAVPLLVTVAETVPPVTMIPDHVLVVQLPFTVFVPSLNFQLLNVLPDGPVAVHVTLLPRVTDEGEQLKPGTVPCELPPLPPVGQLGGPYSLHICATYTGTPDVTCAVTVADPALTP
jgi:hypothetical protein